MLSVRLSLLSALAVLFASIASADVWVHSEYWSESGGQEQVRHTYYDPLSNTLSYEFEWTAPSKFVKDYKCRDSTNCNSKELPCEGQNLGASCTRCTGGGTDNFCSPDAVGSRCRINNSSGGSGAYTCGVQESGTCNAFGDCTGTVGTTACTLYKCIQG